MTLEGQFGRRALLEHEREILREVLAHASFPGAAQLTRQVEHTSVDGGLPTLLDLTVATGAAAAADAVPDGPVACRALVHSPSGDVEGEIIVWVKGGYLAGLEYAWFTDEAPVAIPPASRVRVQ